MDCRGATGFSLRRQGPPVHYSLQTTEECGGASAVFSTEPRAVTAVGQGWADLAAGPAKSQRGYAPAGSLCPTAAPSLPVFFCVSPPSVAPPSRLYTPHAK